MDNPTRDTIHRFFDSSPFSNNSRYLVVTELPAGHLSEKKAIVYVTDLNNNNQIVYFDSTYAWAGQLGTQAQFAGSLLFYNKLSFNRSLCQRYEAFQSQPTCSQTLCLYSIIVDINDSKLKRSRLPCPVYHAASHLTVSVNNLFRFQFTQRGYGIDWLPPLALNNSEDTIVINNIHTRSCTQLMIVSQVAKAINLLVETENIHGFHTKLSYDGKYVLFVLRSLHQPPFSLYSLFANKKKNKKRKMIRVQHLVIISADTDSPEVRYILSWASKPFVYKDQVIYLPDGNHPTWVPNSYDISMNLDVKSLGGREHHYNRRGWATVRILTKDLFLRSADLFHRKFVIKYDDKEEEEQKKEGFVSMIMVSSIGTGHPSYRPASQQIVTDTYLKELPYTSTHKVNLQKRLRKADADYVPIFLTTAMQSNIVDIIAEVPVALPLSVSSSTPSKIGQRRELRTEHDMRCDPHPAWSPKGDKLAVNFLNVTTGKRMVRVFNMAEK